MSEDVHGKALQQAISALGNIKGAGLAATLNQNLQILSTVSDSSYITGPRFANVTKFLWEAAQYHGVKLRIDDRDKGWLRETVYFTISGSKKAVTAFTHDIEESLVEWNNK